MAVEEIRAYQISTGQTFAKKIEAYHEEMVWLLNTRGNVNKGGFDLVAFDEAITQQRDLVAALFDMRKGLDEKQDKKILAELDTFLGDTDTWLASAATLRKDMDQ